MAFTLVSTTINMTGTETLANLATFVAANSSIGSVSGRSITISGVLVFNANSTTLTGTGYTLNFVGTGYASCPIGRTGCSWTMTDCEYLVNGSSRGVGYRLLNACVLNWTDVNYRVGYLGANVRFDMFTDGTSVYDTQNFSNVQLFSDADQSTIHFGNPTSTPLTIGATKFTIGASSTGGAAYGLSIGSTNISYSLTMNDFTLSVKGAATAVFFDGGIITFNRLSWNNTTWTIAKRAYYVANGTITFRNPVKPSGWTAYSFYSGATSGLFNEVYTWTPTIKNTSGTGIVGANVTLLNSSNAILSTAVSTTGGAVNVFDVVTRTSPNGSATMTINTGQTAVIGAWGYFKSMTPKVFDNSGSLGIVETVFMLTDTSLSGISESTASAITTAGIDWTAKTITPTTNLTYDQINARIAYELAQTNGSTYIDPRTITGSNLVLATGWSLIVNTSRTITSGTNITYLYAPTVTINGTGAINALYGNTSGNSTTLTITGFDASSSVYVEDNSAVQKYYSTSASGTVTVYIPPTATGSWYYAVEKYGNQRQSDFFTFSGGLKAITVKAIPDTGITVTNQSTVSAYTALETADKVYDYTAYYRLTTPAISYGQIVFKDGTSINLVDASMLVKSTASNIIDFNYGTKLLTIKSNSLGVGTTYSTIKTTPPATITANTTEVITVNLEDGNGDSSVTIQGGSGNFTLWKITNATAEDDYATGTNLGSVGNITYRFLSNTTHKIVIRDNTTGFRQVVSMAKGIYTKGLFFGDQVQLAQSAEVTDINTKVDVLAVDIDAIKGTGFTKDENSLINISNNTNTIISLTA